MLDIKFVRENPDLVKENIKKKFQDEKLCLVDEVINLDVEARKVQMEADELRSRKNQVSKQIGALMAKGEKEDLAHHVLSPFSKAEQAEMEDAYERAAKACIAIVEKGIDQAMNEFNQKKKGKEEADA